MMGLILIVIIITNLFLLCLKSNTFEPAHEIMALFVLRKLILQTRMPSSEARCLGFGRTLRLLPYLMCMNSKGSGENARMRRPA